MGQSFRGIIGPQPPRAVFNITRYGVLFLGLAAAVVRRAVASGSWIRRIVLLLLATALVSYYVVYLLGYLLAAAMHNRGSKEARAKATYGERYEEVARVRFEDLRRIDPFKSQYSLRGRRVNYATRYRYDVNEILLAVDRERPASLLEVRTVIYEALRSNPWGNRWGGVGDEERYSAAAKRLWDLLNA